MNIHIIHGRLVRDPELTKGNDDKSSRCNFTVATDRRYGDETDFFDCVIFGKRAEVISKYFHKGSEILVSGEGQIRSYEDKNGVKRKAYSVLASDFNFCGSKNDNGNQDSSDSWVKDPEGHGYKKVEPEPEPDGFKEVEEDIPF